MSEAMWKVAEGVQMRRFIIAQDERFQRAMLDELHAIAAEKGRRLIPRARPPAKVPRDMITITRSTPSQAPMTDSQRIIAEVCAKHKITKAEIIGRQRGQEIVIARHEAAYRLKTETTLSLPQIGRRLGGRDHTTIIYGVRAHIARQTGEKPKWRRE